MSLSTPVKHIAVGAIDFGTSYSGFAYSLKDSPSSIYTHRWRSGYAQLETEKTPTCILFDSEKKFVAFGYDAENQYASYTREEQHEMYFLTNYKMALYGKTVVRKELKVHDVLGKEFPLFRAISESLSYIKNALLEHILLSLGEKELAPTDVLYVLTVPAIWSDSAKDFMRQAAEDAGIPGDMLLLCLEPEAAAIYCKSVNNLSLNSRRELSGFVDKFAPTKKYIVVDAGVQTVCSPSPCQHGKCHHLQGASYQCTCDNGYTGTNCDQVQNACSSSPCQHGICHVQGASYQCTCDSGYTGTNCDQVQNACSPNPCRHGTCNNYGSRYHCACIDGYTGTNCDQALGCYYGHTLHKEGEEWREGCYNDCRCVNGTTGFYQCHPLCPSWKLPSVCHLVPPARGKCCATPSCPPNIIVKYPPGYQQGT